MSERAPWVAIQRNPMSGSGRTRPLLEFIAALRRHGLQPRLFSRRDQFDAAVTAPDRHDRLHALVAAGGDGTFLDLVNRHPQLPVGILPLGTENLLARHFRIPRSGADAARIVAAGRRQRLDLGRLGTRRFASMASFGFDAEVIHRAHARRTGHITRSHYLRPIAAALCRYGHPELRLFLDDDPQPVRGRLAIVANLPAYALRLDLVTTARGDDGLFDVRVFEQGSGFQMLRYLSIVICGRHEGLPDVVRRQAARIRVDSDVLIPVQVDGDPAGFTPCELRIEPGAAEIIVP